MTRYEVVADGKNHSEWAALVSALIEARVHAERNPSVTYLVYRCDSAVSNDTAVGQYRHNGSRFEIAWVA